MSDVSAGFGDASAGKRVVLVAAYGDNRAIGHAGSIPWRLPEDFAHFKAITWGHTLVMGRATYDAIGRPLPGRTTIVITRDRDWSTTGVLAAHSFEEALAVAADLPGDVMVAGGAQIYALALPYATHQVLTEVRQSPVADTFYPDFDEAQWPETARIDRDNLSWVWRHKR
ncbi:MAG: dihydrofolate reductase [Nocardioides sp.]